VAILDFFDPNNWQQNNYEHRVYADDYANQYAIVDEIDYQYLVQWRWKISVSKASAGAKRRKAYLARAVPMIVGKDYKDENGKRHQQRITSTVYLHKIVMERSGIVKPNTNKELIVDHANGNGFDCRRKNLRWATRSFNSKNINGCHEYMLIEEFSQC
jgi:hypothetical protein